MALAMSDEARQKCIDWIAAKNYRCSACRGKNFRIPMGAVAVRYFDTETMRFCHESDGQFPLAMVICKECANVMFVSLGMIGAIGP